MIEFDKVSYTYPFQDKPAVTDISFSVSKAEAVVCTGASGSGKSTLIRLINGLAPHFHKGTLSGRVRVAGKQTVETHVKALSSHVGTMFQDPENQFFALRVRDELKFALECRGRSVEEIEKVTLQEADRLGITPLLDNMIFDLSQGEKQRVALAGIMCIAPNIIILDEPSANLDPQATTELAGHLMELKRRGITLFIVDHRLYWLKDLVDKALVLDQGRLVCQGKFELLHDPGIRSKFGLRKPEVVAPNLPEAQIYASGQDNAAHCIDVENLTFGYKKKPLLWNDASFKLPMGQVVAVTGANGTGKTTLARLLTGLLPLKTGTIRINGKALRPKDLLARGSIVLQNTDHQLHMKTVCRELAIAARNNPDRECAVADVTARFGLDSFSARHPQSLSGGQKQRLVIAAALVKAPDILILDEPTSGLDGTNMNMIARVMTGMAHKGAMVLVITHDLELMGLACDCALSMPLS
ncbi:ABC transporter ATP-binding protein [uncultured Desulfobacter sp.]|uniref:ABC transporter ATP-binding protein n=1 Tax=uncultured Desulfobacter sp. TaxID=240139 RepID=UPI002AABEEA0|nr:ABC transporter ATP-binding protein [uncultured Desulfobacter sp.]